MLWLRRFEVEELPKPEDDDAVDVGETEPKANDEVERDCKLNTFLFLNLLTSDFKKFYLMPAKLGRVSRIVPLFIIKLLHESNWIV